MTPAGIFGTWQPEYAARGIVTFPVRVTAEEKRPAIKRYMSIGSHGSSKLTHQFGSSNAIGLVCGQQNGLTVLDIDSSDERLLADAMRRHGSTPFIVRTGSGNYQAWYRHSGERRKVRAWGSHLPIDQLGGGYVVAPPSQGKARQYEILEGTLDDLASLPPMRNAWQPGDTTERQTAYQGDRNRSLFHHCLEQARWCDTLEDILDVAHTFNETACTPPLDDAEVVRVAGSAWGYEQKGQNRKGRHGCWLTSPTLDEMVDDPYFLALIAWLQGRNGPDAEFLVADGLNDQFGWPREKFRATRRKAIQTKWIVPLNKPSPGKGVLYRWGEARRQQ